MQQASPFPSTHKKPNTQSIFPIHNTNFTPIEGHFRRVCEGHRVTIVCSAGRELRIHYASYGRHEQRICAPSGRDTNTWCYTDRSLTVVRNMCQGKRTCTVQASNSNFGDPCVGTVKYLDVSLDWVSSHVTPTPLRMIWQQEGGGLNPG